MSDPKKADTKLVDSPEGGIFGWCYAIFRVSDKELEMTRGLDVVVSTERVVHVVQGTEVHRTVRIREIPSE